MKKLMVLVILAIILCLTVNCFGLEGPPLGPDVPPINWVPVSTTMSGSTIWCLANRHVIYYNASYGQYSTWRNTFWEEDNPGPYSWTWTSWIYQGHKHDGVCTTSCGKTTCTPTTYYDVECHGDIYNQTPTYCWQPDGC